MEGKTKTQKGTLRSDRVGETMIANNGMEMTIIEYVNYDNIRVRFTDGTEARTDYRRFQKGQVKNSNVRTKSQRLLNARNKYLGSKFKTSYGEVEVIEYDGSKNVTVRFMDGTIKTTNTKSLSTGTIKNPNIQEDARISANRKSRVGERRRMCDGSLAKVIGYRNRNDIDIEFADTKEVKEHVQYSGFIKGQYVRKVSVADERVGESKMMNCGALATIVKYRDSGDIDIEFDDGTLRKHVSYYNFLRGSVSIRNDQSRTGTTVRMWCGLDATIKRYHDSLHMDVAFEDGSIVKGVQYSSFIRGQLKHPTITVRGTGKLGSFDILSRSFAKDKEVFYECRCRGCGLSGIYTPQEMLQHRCNVKIGNEE